jgi:hypothetical protein
MSDSDAVTTVRGRDEGVSSFNEITGLEGNDGIALVGVVGIRDMEIVVMPNQRVNCRLKLP